MPPDSDALWVTAASITSTPARAKTSPRAIVPVMPSSSTTRRILALICAVCRYFMNFLRSALDDQDDAADDDDQPGDADQHPAGRVLHGGGRDVLLTAGLAAGRAGDHRERQVGQARVDDRPGQRLEPGAGPAARR